MTYLLPTIRTLPSIWVVVALRIYLSGANISLDLWTMWWRYSETKCLAATESEANYQPLNQLRIVILMLLSSCSRTERMYRFSFKTMMACA